MYVLNTCAPIIIFTCTMSLLSLQLSRLSSRTTLLTVSTQPVLSWPLGRDMFFPYIKCEWTLACTRCTFCPAASHACASLAQAAPGLCLLPGRQHGC
jgi:hypothetical protein